MRRNMVLVGERTGVLYAQEEDGHEQGGHGSGSTLERHDMVPKLLTICDHDVGC